MLTFILHIMAISSIIVLSVEFTKEYYGINSEEEEMKK